jgi:hypothetical protein
MVAVGDTVLYRLSPNDCHRIGEAAARHGWGNSPSPGDVVPLIVVRVWPDEYRGTGWVQRGPSGEKIVPESAVGVNGQAILDGNDSLWICSAPQHSSAVGCWTYR